MTGSESVSVGEGETVRFDSPTSPRRERAGTVLRVEGETVTIEVGGDLFRLDAGRIGGED